MTSEIPKISGDCRKIKLQNFSILRYYSSICATHSCLRCNKLFETAFYSLSIKTLAYHLQWATILSLILWVYLHSFSRCCLPKSRNHTKIR